MYVYRKVFRTWSRGFSIIFKIFPPTRNRLHLQYICTLWIFVGSSFRIKISIFEVVREFALNKYCRVITRPELNNIVRIPRVAQVKRHPVVLFDFYPNHVSSSSRELRYKLSFLFLITSDTLNDPIIYINNDIYIISITLRRSGRWSSDASTKSRAPAKEKMKRAPRRRCNLSESLFDVSITY